MNDAVWIAIIGLGAGVVGSLTATWAQWGVEKRRTQLARRQALVDSWRAGVVAWEESLPDDPSIALNDREPTYVRTEWFASLLPHLDEETANTLYRSHPQTKTTWRHGERIYDNAPILLAEVARIEGAWGLV